ncbi:Tripartite tricarboxylate transporter TctA family protein [compost metagenome]
MLSTVPLFAAILRIPFSIVAPMILMVCAIGAFTVNGSSSDIWMMLLFGVVGYVFKKLDYPLAPMVLALVLGDRMEDAFRQSMLGSNGEVGVFWHNGLSGSIITLALALLFWPLIDRVIQRLKALRVTAPGAA